MGWRIRRYSPLRTNSWPFFKVTTPLQLVPSVSRAQMLMVTPKAVRNRPSIHTAGIWGNNRRLSPFQLFSNSSQNPRVTGRACWAISQCDSSFLALFIPNQSATHTTRKELHNQPANCAARSALMLSQIILGLLLNFESSWLYLLAIPAPRHFASQLCGPL